MPTLLAREDDELAMRQVLAWSAERMIHDETAYFVKPFSQLNIEMDVGDDDMALTQIGKCRMALFMFANHVIQVAPPVPYLTLV